MNPRRPAPEDLKSSPQPIDYFTVRDNFITWLKSKDLNWDFYLRGEIHYLEKYAKPIKNPMDVVQAFIGLTSSQKRHLKNGYRSLFNFYEAQGLADKSWVDVLRRNLPKTDIGVDLCVPSQEEIINSLRVLRSSERFFALYNLLLDSGLRLSEGVKLYNGILEGRVEAERYEGFSIIPLGFFRSTKIAYYGFITEFSLEVVNARSRLLSYKKVMVLSQNSLKRLGVGSTSVSLQTMQ